MGTIDLKRTIEVSKKTNLGVMSDDDKAKRNKEQFGEETLCPTCEGTGNMFFRMYKKCFACNGSGIKKE